MTEQTPAQQYGKFSIAGMMLDTPGYGRPPAGTLETYRQMRQVPSIALARVIATMPIRAAKLTYESESEELRQFVEESLELHLKSLIKNMCWGLDYGFKPFEKVWEVRNGAYHYRKIKPLCVDTTEVLVDEKTGAFKGLKQDKVELAVEYSFLYTHDREDDNYYGRSRHENIRATSYNGWLQTHQKMGQQIRKVAGITPLIEFPRGTSYDASGAEVSNFRMAEALLRKLGSGEGIAMENALHTYSMELLKVGVPLDQLRAWRIEFLQATGSYDFVGTLRYHDSNNLRGWLVPERSATEGQMGTKAEAETHADIGIAVAGETLDEMLEHINWYVINPLLVMNDMPENSVKLIPQPLESEEIKLMREIFKHALSTNVDLLTLWVDVNQALDLLGLPKIAKQVEQEPEPPVPEPEPEPEPEEPVEASMARRILRRLTRRE